MLSLGDSHVDVRPNGATVDMRGRYNIHWVPFYGRG